MQNNNEIFKNGSKTFYTASMFFPKHIRRDVTRLYAYVRTADNYVDQIPQDKKGFLRFRQLTDQAFLSKPITNEIISDFVLLSQEKKFDRAWINAFLDAMQKDLSKKKYATFAELEDYIYGSAEVIGLMMARIMDLPKKADETARLQGKAFQLINFIRDIKEDIELGRQYIPTEDLTKFGIADLQETVDPDAFKRLITFELKRVATLQKKAMQGYQYIPRQSRIPITTAAMIYGWTAEQISQNPMLVFTNKVKPSRMKILTEYTKQTILA